jgi:hypothetical protein
VLKQININILNRLESIIGYLPTELLKQAPKQRAHKFAGYGKTGQDAPEGDLKISNSCNSIM